MSLVKQDLADEPNVGTAWLLLSHAGWLGLSVTSLALSAFVENMNLAHPEKRQTSGSSSLAVGSSVLAVASASWTVYAIVTTWISNTKVKKPVFGHAAFALVLVLAVYLAALAIWSLVVLAKQQM
jgi:hypothetical protein